MKNIAIIRTFDDPAEADGFIREIEGNDDFDGWEIRIAQLDSAVFINKEDSARETMYAGKANNVDDISLVVVSPKTYPGGTAPSAD